MTRGLDLVHKKAAVKFATIDSYVARLRRREQINGKDKPEELMLFKFRKQPKAPRNAAPTTK